MNEIACASCGVPVAESAILERYVHMARDRADLLLAVKCKSYGNPMPYRILDEEDARLMAAISRWERSW